jgi:hypothetical protein
MKYALSTLFCLATILSIGQKIVLFKDKDFPSDKFIVKKEQLTLGTITVDLTQTKPKKQDGSRQFMCRTWLTIKDKMELIKELTTDVNPVGGCSGLFFPESQPNKELIIISKFGDYDGRLFIIDRKGEFKDYSGGIFYVSGDKKYLFTNYDSDLSRISIIDLKKNELIYSGELKQYITDWYFENGEYFTVISEDAKVNGETGLLIFDFKTKTFKEKRTRVKIDLKYKLKVYNDFSKVPDCNCGK